MSIRTVLALDLSTSHGVISLHRDGQPVFESVFQSERSHNAQVFAPLAEALSHVAEGEQAVLVVGTGPGSYTGVRIAIAAAQGVGLSRLWPVLGRPSICTADLEEYSVLGDARRGMFYYARVHSGRLIQPPVILSADQAVSLVEQGGSWVSFDGRPPLNLPQISLKRPDSGMLCRLTSCLTGAEVQEQSGRSLEPFYLQEAFITTARKAGKQVPALQH